MSKKHAVESKPWGLAKPEREKVAPALQRGPLPDFPGVSCQFFCWCNAVSCCEDMPAHIQKQAALLLNDFLTTPAIQNLSPAQAAPKDCELQKCRVARTTPEEGETGTLS